MPDSCLTGREFDARVMQVFFCSELQNGQLIVDVAATQCLLLGDLSISNNSVVSFLPVNKHHLIVDKQQQTNTDIFAICGRSWLAIIRKRAQLNKEHGEPLCNLSQKEKAKRVARSQDATKARKTTRS